MTDTAQPPAAAEPEATPEDPAILAAEAFKVHLGQAPSLQSETGISDLRDRVDEEIDGVGDEVDLEEADATDKTGDAEAPDVAPPSSWPADKAELWASLPPDAQAVIVARDGEREAAASAKVREAAELKSAGEAAAREAQASRQRHAEALDQVLGLIRPQWPSPAMLDKGSAAYDPDGYHLRRAQCEAQQALVAQLSERRRAVAAEARVEEERAETARFQAINNASRDAFIKLVPDVAVAEKAPAIFAGLMDYAVSQGAPPDLFQTPTTALEWAVLWKAKEYDRLQAAKARVGTDPAPAPRRPTAAIRPGVATTRSAASASRRSQDLSRLASEGSVEAGAAMWKHFLNQE